MLRTLDDPKTLQLKLMNSGHKPIHITVRTLPPQEGIAVNRSTLELAVPPCFLSIDITVSAVYISHSVLCSFHHSQCCLHQPFRPVFIHMLVCVVGACVHAFVRSFVRVCVRLLYL